MPEFTKEQRMAASLGGRPLLISAAAGSGKTTVLVERVIHKLTDAVRPTDIDRLLIVTFTNAAAAEMRQRILKALVKRLAEEPRNAHIRRQLALLPRAQIGTIHSFCMDVLRKNAHILGIASDFRIADETECAVIRDGVMRDVMEAEYAAVHGENVGSFVSFIGQFSSSRDDRGAMEAVYRLHRALESLPFPDMFFASHGGDYAVPPSGDAGDTSWGRAYMGGLLERLRHNIVTLRAALEKTKEIESLYASYSPAFLECVEGAERLAAALVEHKWDAAVSALASAGRGRLGSRHGVKDKMLLGAVKAPREALIKLYKEAGEILGYPSEVILDDFVRLEPVVTRLFQLERAFSRAFFEKKQKRGILDFGDLEHLAARLLIGSYDGNTGAFEPSAAALSISREYDEIMIDEYQDTNETQDLILRAVSDRGSNIFMVGDVKQSIYRFRLADPTLFIKKYSAYPTARADAAEEDGDGLRCGEKILLNMNFRSRRRVIDSVNLVFRTIMSSGCGGVDYEDDEALAYGAGYPDNEPDAYTTELLVLDMALGRDEDRDDVEDKNDDDVEGGGPELKRTEHEALAVAGRIREMLSDGLPVRDGEGLRPVRPGDIALLLESFSGKAPVFERALKKRGIPVASLDEDGFFEAGEIMFMLSLLDVIDNPRQDIPLTGALRGPVFGLTDDELAQMRLAAPDLDLYGALTVYAMEGGEECDGDKDKGRGKANAFLRELEYYRAAAPDLGVTRLIGRIYRRANMSALYRGSERLANLDRLRRYAEKYETGGRGELYSFIAYMKKIMEEGPRPGGAPLPAGDGVRLMSIHKSKGLEFPVVFLCDAAKGFNTDDLKEPLLFHQRLGLGLKLRVEERFLEHTTLPRECVKQLIRKESVSEEMRVLYVAMTRAKEKLVISGSYTNFANRLAAIAPVAPAPREAAHQDTVSGLGCFSDWLLLTLFNSPDFSETARAYGYDTIPSEGAVGCIFNVRVLPPGGYDGERDRDEDEGVAASREDASANTRVQPDSGEVEKYAERIRRSMAFVYPFERAVMTPSKLTATQLKGRFWDIEAWEDGDETPSPLSVGHAKTELRKPYFEKNRPLSPSERGTALHLALQYMDFARFLNSPTLDGLRGEMTRLEEAELLTPAQARAVDCGRLLAFFNSDLGRRMATSDSLRREFKFSVLLPPQRIYGRSDGYKEDDRILFQGVVDAFFVENGRITVVDFKTDGVNPYTVSARAEAYRPQVTAYADVLTEITGLPAGERILYFFAIDREILV